MDATAGHGYGAPMGARAGKLVLSFTALATAVAPIVADLNDTHLHNPAWPPHARFHGVLLVSIMAGTGALSLWLLWARCDVAEVRIRTKVAALLSAIVWASFFVAVMAPGTSEWPDGLARPLPVNPNLITAGVLVALSALGLWLARRKASIV